MRQCGKIRYSYKHTLRICNTYCHSTATMIPQMPLNVTFIPGLSPKIPNNFLNKSFSDLLWSYWALFPATYSSPVFIHCSQCFVRFCKHSWNASCGIWRSSSSEFSLISRTDSNLRPFGTEFSFQPFFSPPQIRPFSPHCLSQPLHHHQIILLVHHLATK